MVKNLMSRLISKAEGWEVAYNAFQNINFAAYDYYTIKQSMIEYLQLYFAESFNDYIESSEFIALLELFAYVGELIAYRFDINANENSIDNAQRKQSVLKLVKLISYKSSRNVPARGLVKINSISTSERVFDLNGIDLSNSVINWNDSNNPNWKEQFLTVIERVFEQPYGSVSPNERIQIQDILFELYPLKNELMTNGVIPYNITVNSRQYEMELVPARLTDVGPEEARPSRNGRFTVLYANDGLGDNSTQTGFFIFTKQGTLLRKTQQFDGIIPNQTFDLTVDNINNTDVWVNNVDLTTGDTIDDGKYPDHASGEWQEVDLANAQNIIFNTNPVRTKYEVETLENDRVRIIFGDGEFSDIPSGAFDIWYRTSSPDTLFIPQTSIVNKRTAFKYVDSLGRIQTITITYSLINSIQNNAPSEDIEHIRRTAPSVYYAQDRMVNAKDYNTFPMQDSSILKLRTINRTFAGDTAFQSANDASLTYQDVKLFGDDINLMYVPSIQSISAPGSINNNVLILNFLEPLLSTIDLYVKHLIEYGESTYRREFTNSEKAQFINVFDDVNYPWPVSLVYYDENDVGGAIIGVEGQPHLHEWVAYSATTNLGGFEPTIKIALSSDVTTYTITYSGERLVADSPTTRFYYDNSGQKVLSFDTLNSNNDLLTIIKANKSSYPNQLLEENISLHILQVERYEQGLSDTGLPNYNRVTVSPIDKNGDDIPDNMLLTEIMDYKYDIDIPSTMNYVTPLKIDTEMYIAGKNDTVLVVDNVNATVVFAEGGFIINAVNSSSDNSAIPSEAYNTFFVLGNKLGEIATGNTIQVTCPYTDQNGLYRVDTVSYTGSYTKIKIVTDPLLVNPEGEYPLVKNAIAGSSHQGSASGGIITVLKKPTNHCYILTTDIPTSGVLTINEYVYLKRDVINEPYEIIETSIENGLLWANDVNNLYKRYPGKSNLNFLWQHRSSQMNLIDPSPTNIHDMFIITRSYYTELVRWLSNETTIKPTAPTSSELRLSYMKLLDNKMISDTVILHSGKVKVLIGTKANPELQAKIKVIRTNNNSLTDNQIKIRIVNIVRDFFKIDQWEFGETFYYSELDAVIKTQLPSLIASTVLVPNSANHTFGDLYQVFASEDEVLQVHITVDDVEIVNSYSSANLHQFN